MNKKFSKALTDGLTSGYTGSGEITETSRAGFIGKASHVVLEGGTYHDEWFVPKHVGGGQELVKIGEEMFTRVYAGGTPDLKVLAELEISEKEVGVYLKKKINELGEATRLDADCKPVADGEWRYEYEVLLNDEKIGVIVGAESIYYKGERVHLHPFILSPVA